MNDRGTWLLIIVGSLLIGAIVGTVGGLVLPW